MKKEKVGMQFQKDTAVLKEIIKELLEVDIDTKSRKRDIVDAKGLYAKILHDKGYSFPMIGKSLDNDHSTIVHHNQKITALINFDDEIKQKHTMCRDEFFARSPINNMYDSKFEVYKNEIMHLKKRLQYIEFKEKELSNLEYKYKRLNNIINFIDENTVEGEEDRVKCKIYAAFKN